MEAKRREGDKCACCDVLVHTGAHVFADESVRLRYFAQEMLAYMLCVIC